MTLPPAGPAIGVGVEIAGRANYMVFVRDTTAEIKRRERIALLNLVADKTNRAVVVTDRQLQIVYTNAAFSGMFGYSPEEAQGRQARDLLAGRFTDRKTLTKLRRRISMTAALKRKSWPTTGTAMKSGSRPWSSRSATRADGSSTSSRLLTESAKTSN